MKKALYIVFIIISSLQLLTAQTVYITDTGEKYHESGCRYLSKSKHAIELKDAINSGYGACKICTPPVLTTTKYEPQQQSNQNKQSSSTQCTATTKAGSRCKRMTTSANGFCYQHGG